MIISESFGRFDLYGRFQSDESKSFLEITCESDDFSFCPARIKGKPLGDSVTAVEEQLENLILELQSMLLKVREININSVP